MRCNKRTGMILVVVGLIVASIVAAARKNKEGGEPSAQPTMWDKMRQGMEEMPEDFPPRVMYDNVATTRTNTERILEILEEKTTTGQPTADTATADA